MCPNVQNKSWKWFEINLLPQSSCTAMVKRVLVKQFEKWRTPWEPSIKVVHLESCITFLLIAWGVSYSSFNNGRIPLETRADNKASHGLRFTGGNGGLIINNDLYINSFSLEGVDLRGVTDQFPMNQSFATLGSHQEQERRQSVPLLNKNGSLVWNNFIILRTQTIHMISLVKLHNISPTSAKLKTLNHLHVLNKIPIPISHLKGFYSTHLPNQTVAPSIPKLIPIWASAHLHSSRWKYPVRGTALVSVEVRISFNKAGW